MGLNDSRMLTLAVTSSLICVKVRCQVGFRDVTESLPKDRLQCSSIHLLVRHTRQCLTVSRQQHPPQLNVAPALRVFGKAELREDP